MGRDQRPEPFGQFRAILFRQRRTEADMVQQPCVVITRQAIHASPDGSRDHAVGGPVLLDLQHRARPAGMLELVD